MTKGHTALVVSDRSAGNGAIGAAEINRQGGQRSLQAGDQEEPHERQSMTHSTDQPGPMYALTVGKPYLHGHRAWPEVADYKFCGGGHELRLFIADLTPWEVEAVRSGPIEFGLLADHPVLFLGVRFLDPAGKVVMSFDCSYTWHRVQSPQRVLPPPAEEVSPELRALCQIILVESTDGLVRVLRGVTFSPAFTRAIHKVIGDQAALPYDQAEHNQAVEAMLRFTTDELWAKRTIRCREGE
jgi:hypothetical protein